MGFLLGQVDEVAGIATAINQYGIAAITAVLIVFFGAGARGLYKLFCDSEKGILIVTHKQLIETINSNAQANESNSRANETNARANEVHADAHRRTSIAISNIATKLKVSLDEECCDGKK